MTMFGVDSHQAQLTLAALADHGQGLGTTEVANTAIGWATARAWAATFPAPHTWGVAGSGSDGWRFAQILVETGAAVSEVSAHLMARYRRRARRRDKTDPLDAQPIAQVVLVEGAALPPVAPAGTPDPWKLLSRQRDALLTARTAAINQLRRLLERWEPGSTTRWSTLTAPAVLVELAQWPVVPTDPVA
ncbi:MAG: transposase [Deinococcus sp.]|nr:transposase [Deinococcus sp.]